MNTMLYAAQRQIESEKGPRPGAPERLMNTRPQPMRGLMALEKTLQAGIILNFLATLPDTQAKTLVAKYRSPHALCNCSNPCCSGFKKDKDWKEAIQSLATLLTEKAERDRVRGHKGFKTIPPLLVRILERMFDPKSRLSMLDIAEVCDVSPATVSAHGKHIGAILDDWKKDGLMAMDYILVHEGIVGALE